MSNKIRTITLTRAEGPIDLTGIAYTVPNFTMAEMILDQMVEDDTPLGIDKVDWIIETVEGDQYQGTYYLQAERQGLLEQHINRANGDLQFLDTCDFYGQDKINKRKQAKEEWIKALKSW